MCQESTRNVAIAKKGDRTAYVRCTGNSYRTEPPTYNCTIISNGLPLLAPRHLVSLPVSTPLRIVNRCWSCSCKWRYINVDL